MTKRKLGFEGKNPKTAFEAAVELIKHYVLRDDNMAQMMGTGLGVYSDLWKAQIGGFFWNGPEAHKKRYTNKYILVHRFNGKDCTEAIPIQKVIEHIQALKQSPKARESVEVTKS
jgi:hypothetical protein